MGSQFPTCNMTRNVPDFKMQPRVSNQDSLQDTSEESSQFL